VLTLKLALNYLVYIHQSKYQWVYRLCPAFVIPNTAQHSAHCTCIHPQVKGRETLRWVWYSWYKWPFTINVFPIKNSYPLDQCMERAYSIGPQSSDISWLFSPRMGKGHTVSCVVYHSHRNQVILVIYYSQYHSEQTNGTWLITHPYCFCNPIRIHGIKIDDIW
jgi:hypothetical protein